MLQFIEMKTCQRKVCKNLKTSHVTVYPLLGAKAADIDYNLKTSHVTVYL